MVLALGLVVTACVPVEGQSSGDAQWLAGRLNGTVAAKNEAAFDALFTNQAAAGSRHWIWQNLMILPKVSFAVDGDTLTANWRATADTLDITNRVGLVSCTTATNCRVDDLGPQTGEPAPIWAVQPLASLGIGKVTVFGAQDDASLHDWMWAAQSAQIIVAGAGLGELASAWDGWLVVELPRDAGAMAQLLGRPTVAGYTTTGALTWVERQPGGGPPDAGPVAHIIVNPLTTGSYNTPPPRTLLLTHEAVHVATAAVPVAPGATWVSEGLAEKIALGSSIGGDRAEAAQAKTACTADGLTPPPDEAFGGTDVAGQSMAYAVSQVLVGLIQEHLGESAMDAIAALWRGQDAPGVDLEAWSKAWCV